MNVPAIDFLRKIPYNNQMPEFEPDTTADSVEKFIMEYASRSRMNTKAAHEEAKLCWLLEQTTIDFIDRYPKTGKIGPNVFIGKSQYAHHLAVYNPELIRIGARSLNLTHGLQKFPGDFAGLVGIDSSDRIDFGVHTDASTSELVHNSTTQLEKKLLQTIYLFDEYGNYGKVVSLPKAIPDSRIDLSNNAFTQKYVEGVMTPEDFELARTGLWQLKQIMRGYLIDHFGYA